MIEQWYIVYMHMLICIACVILPHLTHPTQGEKAVDKALEMIGEWKAAFGQQSGYKAVNDMFSELQRQGYQIPEAEVASAAFLKKAPEWVLGDRCYICRNEFHRFKGAFRVCHCRLPSPFSRVP